MSKKNKRAPRRPRLPDELEKEQNLRAIMGEASPLLCAIIGCAILEHALMCLLAKAFVEEEEAKTVFDVPNGTLSSFSSCYQVAFCMGLFGRNEYNTLKAIGNIRNRFAHSDMPLDFSDSVVAAWCRELRFMEIVNSKGDVLLFQDDVERYAGNDKDRFILAVAMMHLMLLAHANEVIHKTVPPDSRLVTDQVSSD